MSGYGLNQKEKNWIRRLQKCLNAQPESLSIFDSEGTSLDIYKSKQLPINDTESVDQTQAVDQIHITGSWDCGAY